MSYISCHNYFLRRRASLRPAANKSELQASGASRVGQRFHFPVIAEPSTVKYHSFYFFLQSPFREKRADLFCHNGICVCPALSSQTLLDGCCGYKRFARGIVNYLCINVPA
jgi:hypothetical protein